MCSLLDRIGQIKMLKKGRGFQYLLNEASKILGNPMLMFDTEYILIAFSEGVVTDDRFWNEITTTGSFSYEAQEFFKEEGFIDSVANSKTITFMFSDRLKYDRIQGKLFNKNNKYVANLVAVMCNRPLAPDDAAVFEAICKTFSNEISSIEFYQNYEKTYDEKKIRELIEGRVINKELYSAQMAILYDGFKTNLFVAVLKFIQCEQDYSKLASYRDMLRRLEPRFKYSIYENYIVVLISSDNTSIDIKRDLNKINRLFKQKNVYAGISGSFENIYELPKYYAAAVKTMNDGLTSPGTKRIFLFGETGTKSS